MCVRRAGLRSNDLGSNPSLLDTPQRLGRRDAFAGSRPLRSTLLRLALLHLGVAGLVGGCSSGPQVIVECSSSSDCAGGEICRDGLCREACAEDDPCSAGTATCEFGICVDAACQEDRDCQGGEHCENGMCVPLPSGCSSDEECRGGERCESGTCVPIVPAGCVSDDDCEGGERCTSGECVDVPVMTCSGDSDCNGGERCNAGTCEPISPQCNDSSQCNSDERCEDGTCVSAPMCSGPADCDNDERCDSGRCVPQSTDCTTDGCPNGQVCRAGECVRPPSEGCGKIDLLFVIDDSGSMQEEQGNLMLQSQGIVDGLDGIADGLVDWRIGVTTTGRDITTTIEISGFPAMTLNETGPAGALLQPEGCSMPRKWIERSDANRAETFGCLAQVGISGSSYEMPLLMSQWAITERVEDGTNAGFLRPDAMLAVIVITDENDCSHTDPSRSINPLSGEDACDNLVPVATLREAIAQAKPNQWAMYFIAADRDCSGIFGDATAATRLIEFAEGTTRASLDSICVSDLAAPISRALQHIEATCS